MKIGVTGHQRLTDAQAWPWVKAAIDEVLRSISGQLVGYTSLAAGADQLFARCVLEQHGTLVAVIPFPGYELKFSAEAERTEYDRLLSQAASKEVLEAPPSDEEGYLRAGQRVVNETNLMLAVWEGKPSAGLGGTADIVAYAIGRGRPLVHLNPLTRSVIRHHA